MAESVTKFICLNSLVTGAFLTQEVYDGTEKTIKIEFKPTRTKKHLLRKENRTEDVYFERDIITLRPLNPNIPGAENEIKIALKNKDGESYGLDQIFRHVYGDDNPLEKIKKLEKDIDTLKTQLKGKELTINRLQSEMKKQLASQNEDRRVHTPTNSLDPFNRFAGSRFDDGGFD